MKLLEVISRSVMVASVNFTKPRMTTKDAKATYDAEVANNAHGAGKFVKDLYPRHLIEPIVSFENDTRAFLYSVTRRVDDQQLLPTSRYTQVAVEMGNRQLQHRQLVTAFANNYANVLHLAAQSQGDLFDAGVYPDVSAVTGQFSMQFRVRALAQPQQILKATGLDAGTLQQIERETEAQITASLGESLRDSYRDLYSAVERVAVQCGKEKGRIYDTLMTDLDHLCEVLPDLNFTGDPQLIAFIEECKTRISYHPDTLRVDPLLRSAAATSAADIMEKMRRFV